MRSLYALYLSLSLVIPAIQPHLRLSGTNRLRSAFHGGQRSRFNFPSRPRILIRMASAYRLLTVRLPIRTVPSSLN
ncbi:MAG: hypothetical protein KZQ59_01270 [Candidatus Thiodiazotropha sp. (ex Lucinoma aequizonata)]|nr:hypothetical protein [Candidatus Thiodiazotropha sp. (ex Lucinoma aequizonata)]MCU7893839.1 hypothetical protein [Candidatus Thiodiazotropha sp. (ex Lucinoma aequizonata)]MCU7897501.1 hypothetical protein [Candidatus Thiodiazotropha sp. (ex Lucinoma aequizonata)]MCU7910034.1 hypothetical protein [Candidatus Thiodiazotropha sp. (ex Lucinoma aequizonata)]MCU7911983.1 hypothetical protein [Candidatus Thiodiazotropha sp. (ex Lucinoma aequizonata)]